MKRNFLLVILLSIPLLYTFGADRWQMLPDGGICWLPASNLPHEDHVELSGRQVSVVLRYGVRADGSSYVNKSMVWPMLRTIPNNTHASFMRRFEWEPALHVALRDGSLGKEQTDSIILNGTLRIVSRYPQVGLRMMREYFPSPTKAALIERITVENIGKGSIEIEIPHERLAYASEASQGVNGSYDILLRTESGGNKVLKAGASYTFGASIQAFSKNKGEQAQTFNATEELRARRELVGEWSNNLVLVSPDSVIDRMFRFAKIRACESIFQTAGGPIHCPGGETFYAAIWANDQAEYANPFFPFAGYAYANAAALNSFEWFARYMNKDFRPIPSSIIAEGKDIWNGAGDRGDAAMIAYGAARFALTCGNKAEAQKLWPLIQWCLEYCQRKLNAEGVVLSNCDELEGRFPAGEANLCTSTLYYDALISAAFLSRALGHPHAEASAYRKQAGTLRNHIEQYFGADMQGYHTYRYFKGNDKLRSWICMPLVVGIFDRTDGTIDALFSSDMWTENGLLTQQGSQTFWDRSTLYALRGVYNAGRADKATGFLHYYSSRRLLGEHVPYAIEAWPEGNQRHLSAESALYCRIITEGLFGIRPTGLRSFLIKPELPESWNFVRLDHVRAFGSDFNISVKRQAKRFDIDISNAGRTQHFSVKPGQSVEVKL